VRKTPTPVPSTLPAEKDTPCAKLSPLQFPRSLPELFMRAKRLYVKGVLQFHILYLILYLKARTYFIFCGMTRVSFTFYRKYAQRKQEESGLDIAFGGPRGWKNGTSI
ncbi:MAG: hypothetical protein AB7E32_17895, partial [Desulfovibrio sp.]